MSEICPDCNGTGEYRGLNTVEPCATCQPIPLSLNDSEKEFVAGQARLAKTQAAFYEQFAMPSHMIVAGPQLTDAQRDELQQRFKQLHQGDYPSPMITVPIGRTPPLELKVDTTRLRDGISAAQDAMRSIGCQLQSHCHQQTLAEKFGISVDPSTIEVHPGRELSDEDEPASEPADSWHDRPPML